MFKKIVLILFIFTFLNTSIVFADSQNSFWNNSKAQVTELFNEVFLKVENYRKKQADFFIKKRDNLKKALKINGHSDFTNTTNNLNLLYEGELSNEEIMRSRSEIKLGQPMDYFWYIFYIPLATLFSDSIIFYASIVLLFLIITRYISKISFKWYN